MTYIFALAAVLSLLLGPARAQPPQTPVSTGERAMTGPAEQQARAVIAPWYSLFNAASRGDVKAIQEQILTAAYESCAGDLPGECWGRQNFSHGKLTERHRSAPRQVSVARSIPWTFEASRPRQSWSNEHEEIA